MSVSFQKKKDDECDHEAGQVVFFAHAFCSSRVDLTDVSVWYVHFFFLSASSNKG